MREVSGGGIDPELSALCFVTEDILELFRAEAVGEEITSTANRYQPPGPLP